MNASLPVIEQTGRGAINLDPRTYSRALSCVHCGLCLPACPTYTTTGHEGDSPRGRIQLMRGLADGTIEASESVRHHLDLCLDCRGCETACPSGVVYHELIEETRARLAESQTPTLQDRFMRWIFFNVFIHPTRLKLALLPARLLQKIGLYELLRKTGALKILPPQLRKMEQMLPPTGPLWPKPLPEHVAPATAPAPPTGFQPVLAALASLAGGEPSTTMKITVGFFPGCIGSVMFESVNRMAVEL